MLGDRLRKSRQAGREPAADHRHRGMEQFGQPDDGRGDRRGALAHCPHRPGVGREPGCAQVREGHLRTTPLGGPAQGGRPRCGCLHTSAAAAVTAGPAGRDDQMSDLAGAATGPRAGPAAEHDPAADARPDPQVDHVLTAGRVRLRERGQIAVVAADHGGARQQIPQRGAEVEPGPGRPARPCCDPAGGVDGCGHRHADGVDPTAPSGGQRGNVCGEIVDVLGGGRRRRPLEGCLHRPDATVRSVRSARPGRADLLVASRRVRHGLCGLDAQRDLGAAHVDTQTAG